MLIEKVLNNNVVISIDPKSKKEIILLGSGIAFNKKVGQEIEDKKIEKTFIIDDQSLGNKLKKLINQIPDGVFQLAHEIIAYASKELNVKFDKQIYISLSDHIAFAIKRYKKNIVVKNELLSEIKRVHRREYKVALWAVDFLNSKLNIELPEDEAGFIALHFINASFNETTSNTVTYTKVVKDILNIIRYYFSLEFKEDDLNYDRLVTHLKYFSKRIINNNQDVNSEDEFIEMVKLSYSKAYGCTLKVSEYIKNNYNYEVNDSEKVYLTLHIQRIISAVRDI